MERNFSFSVGEHYHLYTRGVDKMIIFKNKSDYERFQRLLYICNGDKPVVFKLVQGVPLDEVDRGESLVTIIAYTLMPNHLHIIVQEKDEGGVTKFMGKLMTAYSMYFNKKYERSGPLFTRPFRAEHVDNDSYFRWIFSYVHLNPISLVEKDWKNKGIHNQQKVKRFLDNYKYSSFIDYVFGDREEKLILSFEDVPDFLIEQNDLEDLLKESRNK